MNMFRNGTVALPTILVLALVLTLLHGTLALFSQAEAAVANLQQKFSFTVYLKDDADPVQIGNLITVLEQRSDIKPPVIYTSKEAAWEIINKTFALDPTLFK